MNEPCPKCGEYHNQCFELKQLTDEEMEEVIRKHWNKEYGNRNMLTLCKAVLKEAQEK